MTFSRDGNVLSTLPERTVAVKPKLSFRDAQLDNFGELIRGAKKGDRREATLKISPDVDNERLKGQEVRAEFEVVKVEKLQLPKLTATFLNEVGGFTDEADLRKAVREELERQMKYRQQQAVRQQITSSADGRRNWALPPALLRKQTKREVQRMVLELQSAGFSNDVIQAHANDIVPIGAWPTPRRPSRSILSWSGWRRSTRSTRKPDDYSREIELIAEQSGMPARRVRARLEKRGEMDSLRNQIVERKVIELITSHALVQEVPYEPPADDVVAIDYAISGVEERESHPRSPSRRGIQAVAGDAGGARLMRGNARGRDGAVGGPRKRLQDRAASRNGSPLPPHQLLGYPPTPPIPAATCQVLSADGARCCSASNRKHW